MVIKIGRGLQQSGIQRSTIYPSFTTGRSVIEALPPDYTIASIYPKIVAVEQTQSHCLSNDGVPHFKEGQECHENI